MDRTHTLGPTLLSIQGSDPTKPLEGGVNLWLGEGSNRRHILRDVNVQVKDIIRPNVKQGQCIGLLGPSGIGKTQLFNLIAGFKKPDSGQILLGMDQTPTAPGRVGVVTQDYVVFMHMTVLQNLVFAGKQGGLTAADANEKAMHYLTEFDLADRKDNWPGQLSGGQRQRLAILQQIMVGHLYICMDEPFSGLDINQVRNVAELVTQVLSLDELLTIIVVTHDIGAAIETSDTLWVMGKERGEKDTFKDGARIVCIYDLIGLGLAWDPDIRHNPQFMDLQSRIVEEFRGLAHC